MVRAFPSCAVPNCQVWHSQAIGHDQEFSSQLFNTGVHISLEFWISQL